MGGTVIVSPDDLTRALKVAAVTTTSSKEDPTYGSIYIHSDRRTSDSGGDTDVLVFTGYNGTSVGQYSIDAEGTLDHPILLDSGTAPSINAIIKDSHRQIPKEIKKTAELTVRVSVATSLNGITEVFLVQCLTDGVVGETDGYVAPVLNSDVEIYPLEDALIYLAGTPTDTIRDHDGKELPQGEARVFSAEQSRVMNGIQGIIKDELLYAYPLGHTAGRRILTCENWRGSVPGSEYPVDADLDSPEVDVLFPDKAKDTMAALPKRKKAGESLHDSVAHVETLV